MPERNNYRSRSDNDRGYRRGNDDFRYDIVERFGVVSTSHTGWSKELNRVSWNGNEPKYDFREWSPDHGKMHRGVTFTEEEAIELRNLLDIALSGGGYRNLHYQDVRERGFQDDQASSYVPDTGNLIDEDEMEETESLSA